NFRVIASALADLSGVRVLEPPVGCTPFAVTLLFDDRACRDRVRRALIDSNVYPAVLWPTSPQAKTAAVDLSSRLLTVHCDFRYSEGEMRKTGTIVRRCIQEALLR